MTATERALRADLKRAAAFLRRFERWHPTVPDASVRKWPPGTTGALVQNTRTFLKTLETRHGLSGGRAAPAAAASAPRAQAARPARG